MLILTDTQGVNVLGCYGLPELNTPHIDRLAREGIRFDCAYTTCPVCAPARGGLFTGTFPHTNGVWGNHMAMGANIRTVGQRLSDQGMHCAYIGKWHLSGTDYFDTGICPEGWDADYWFDGRNYLETMNEETRRRSRELDNAPKIHEADIGSKFTYAHQITDRALRFIETHHDEDFLLVVSYDEPHHPYTCPPPYCDMFADYHYPQQPNFTDSLEGKPSHVKEWADSDKKPADYKTGSDPMYFGCSSYVDAQIGRVVNAIDRHTPEAMAIFTSDHGTPLGAHGIYSKGPAMYDEVTRIPFIVRWPGEVTAGSVSKQPLSQIDVTPSLLDYFGMPIPDFIEGKSMLAMFQDIDVRINEIIFMEFNRFEIDHDGWGGLQPIRCAFDGRYKLSINLHSEDELYDMAQDPGEMENVINSPETAGARDRLHTAILDWMDQTRDPFRGPVWERRPWRKDQKMKWDGPRRVRPEDGYEKRMILYDNGLDVTQYVFEEHK